MSVLLLWQSTTTQPLHWSVDPHRALHILLFMSLLWQREFEADEMAVIEGLVRSETWGCIVYLNGCIWHMVSCLRRRWPHLPSTAICASPDPRKVGMSKGKLRINDWKSSIFLLFFCIINRTITLGTHVSLSFAGSKDTSW